MKPILWTIIALTLAACGGESKTETKQPAPSNSIGDSAQQMHQKSMDAAKSVETLQKQQAQQMDDQAK